MERKLKVAMFLTVMVFVIFTVLHLFKTGPVKKADPVEDYAQPTFTTKDALDALKNKHGDVSQGDGQPCVKYLTENPGACDKG